LISGSRDGLPKGTAGDERAGLSVVGGPFLDHRAQHTDQFPLAPPVPALGRLPDGDELADGPGGVLDPYVAIALPRLVGQRIRDGRHGRGEAVARSAAGGRLGIAGTDLGELPRHGVGRPEPGQDGQQHRRRRGQGSRRVPGPHRRGGRGRVGRPGCHIGEQATDLILGRLLVDGLQHRPDRLVQQDAAVHDVL
jgi:hypothetical protein